MAGKIFTYTYVCIYIHVSVGMHKHTKLVVVPFQCWHVGGEIRKMQLNTEKTWYNCLYVKLAKK